MGSYRISVRRDATDDELDVIVHDDTGRSALGKMSALSHEHAELVARDLLSLLRKSDPGSFFTLDLREPHAAH
jgi:hypothetical protein